MNGNDSFSASVFVNDVCVKVIFSVKFDVAIFLSGVGFGGAIVLSGLDFGGITGMKGDSMLSSKHIKLILFFLCLLLLMNVKQPSLERIIVSDEANAGWIVHIDWLSMISHDWRIGCCGVDFVE